MEQELRNLIDKYERLLHDHRYPIDMTTYEQTRLNGYDSALIHIINDLRCILLNRNTEESPFSYTE